MNPLPLRRVSRLWRSLAAGAGSAAFRFPVAVLLIIVFAVLSNLVVAEIVEQSGEVERILAALSGAAAASLAVTLAMEEWTKRPMLPVLLSLLVAAGVGVAIWLSRPFPIYAPALLTACVSAIPLAPYLGRGNAREFWSFTLWTSVGVVLAFLSVLIFLLGVTAILEMVRYLFRVGLGTRTYEHMFTIALTLIGPLFALGRIPLRHDDHATFQPDDRLVRTVRPLFDWVSAPLALATALILHVYVARILVSGEVPRGEIGWIVGFFSTLVIGLRIAIDPFIAEGRTPARLFGRLWAPMLVIPLGLLAYAVEQRVSEQGFTAARYFLALAALSVGLILVAQLWRRTRDDIRVLAFIPIVLLAGSTFGPWGVADIVGRSQEARLRAEFGTELGAGANVVAALPMDAKQVLRSRLRALDDVAELHRVESLLPDEARQEFFWNTRDLQLAEIRLLVGLGGNENAPSTMRSFSGRTDEALDIGGFDTAFISLAAAPGPIPSGAAFAVTLEASDLVIVWNGVTDRVRLDETLASLMTLETGGERSAAAAVADFVSTGGRYVRLRVEQMSTESDGRTPATLVATILLRANEWAPR